MPRKRPDATEQDQRTTTTIRLRQSELDEIRHRASVLGLTLTDYMIRKALGQPTGDESYDERLESVEKRLQRAEELLFS